VGFFVGAEIKKVSVTGGPPVTICRFTSAAPRGASWGTDNTIVFATSDPRTGLMKVSATGGDPQVLTRPDVDHGEQDHFWPSVLPGARAVLFTVVAASGAGAAENAQVAVLDLKTGQRKILVRGGSHAEYVETGHLIYGLEGTLRAVRFDPERLETLGDPVSVLDQVVTTGTGAADFGVSRQGMLVYIPGTGPGVARLLVWVNRQGLEEPIKAPPHAYSVARLSPDGSQVALEVRDQSDHRVDRAVGDTVGIDTFDGAALISSVQRHPDVVPAADGLSAFPGRRERPLRHRRDDRIVQRATHLGPT
jgi:hypothetical protein